MTPQEYLQQILKDQDLGDDTAEMRELRKHRQQVEDLLRDTFGSTPTIRYGGSKAKGTLNRESYDLDITCYFLHDDESAGETLEDEP